MHLISGPRKQGITSGMFETKRRGHEGDEFGRQLLREVRCGQRKKGEEVFGKKRGGEIRHTKGRLAESALGDPPTRHEGFN